MRNVGQDRYYITIEAVSYTKDANGALIPQYTEVTTTSANKRITRYGEGGTKKRAGMVEYNPERLEFRVLPEVPIEFDNIVKYLEERYEIAALQKFYDRTIVVCYTTPLSNVRRRG